MFPTILNPFKENLLNLKNGGIYSRTSSGVTNDFMIQIDFDKPHQIDWIEFHRPFDNFYGGDAYASLYKNTCLIATYADGSTGEPNCTDENYGFSNSKQQLFGINSEEWNSEIVFGMSWPYDETLRNNVVKIQLIFDTSATGSDTLGANAAEYAQNNAVQIERLMVNGHEEY